MILGILETPPREGTYLKAAALAGRGPLMRIVVGLLELESESPGTSESTYLLLSSF